MALIDEGVTRRSFLRGGATAAALAAASAMFGCAPSNDPAPEPEAPASNGADAVVASAEERTAHVVESDVAILEGKGRWQGAQCAKRCSIECAPCQYVVDGVPVRAKNLDYFEETSFNCNYQTRGCHGARVSRRWIYGQARNKYPMKRKHWQPGGGDNVNGELRGKDEWERISWDDALDMAASEIKRIYETYGPTSTISFISVGTGIQNIMNLMGGYVDINDTISCGSWQADHGWWGLPGYGFSAIDPQDWVNADYYVLASYDFLFTQNTASTCYLAAKEAGVKFVYVGPCLNQSAQLLEARWIPVRPGTDTAFWNGVAYEMVKLDEERGDVIDWDFLKKYTRGFTMDNMPDDAKLEECYQGYLLGEYDGVPKTAAWASKICGSSEQDIKDMAEILGKNNNVIMASANAAARNTGTENYAQAFFTLGLLGGHMGKSGNGVHGILFGNNFKAMGYTGEQGRAMSSTQNPLKYEEGEYVNLGGHPSNNRNIIAAPLHWRDMLAGHYTSYGAHSQQEYPPVYNSGVPHDIDVKFIWNGKRNFLSMSIDVFNAIKVYRNCEFVLTQQPYASTAARFADIVLPVATSWEGSLDPAENCWPSGTDNRYTGAEIVHCKYPVSEPLWEARSDDRIAREIGERLGFNPDEIAGGNALQSYFDAMAGGRFTTEDGEVHTLLGITQETIDHHNVTLEPQEGDMDFEDFVENGGWHFPRKQGDKFSQARCWGAFYDDPEGNPLPSASGLWEIYSQGKADNFNTPDFVNPDEPCKPYPNYYVPTMGWEKTFKDWDKQVKGDYPYVAYTFHACSRHHSSVYSPLNKECYPHPLYINPADAKEKGLKTGDTVRIWNPDGACILRQCVLMEGTMPGCLGLAEGGTLDLDESDPDNWIDRGGSVNVVTPAVRSNYMPGLSGYGNGIVNIEKYDGEPVKPDCERDLFEIA